MGKRGRAIKRKAEDSTSSDGVSSVLKAVEDGSTAAELEASNGTADGAKNGVNGVELTRIKRIYRHKESFMTVLCANDKNIEALYHFFMLMMVCGLGYSLLQDSVEAGTLYIDLTYYFSGFGPPLLQVFSMTVWGVLQSAALLVYPMFKLWQKLYSSGFVRVNFVFVLLMITYNIAGHTAVVWVSYRYKLSPVPSIFLLVEQLRFTMKSYSFVRENAYKVLYPWHKDDKSGPAVWYAGQISPTVGSFRQYCYYLFCPTLLYRDHYPRTPSIRWLKVLSYVMKCSVSVAFVTVLTKEIFSRKLTSSPPSVQLFMSVFLTCSLWGLVFQFMAGYFFLHSWCNLFAELLRFADREFYSDWWTCTSYATFYRKWNLLVHEWIKAYIYQDFKDFFKSPTYNKLASLPTFAISAIIHEYLLWGPFRFVLPVLLVQFGSFGVMLYFIRPAANTRFWNYFIHSSLHMGVSIMVFSYAMESYARMICVEDETLVNTFIPRIYQCFILGEGWPKNT